MKTEKISIVDKNKKYFEDRIKEIQSILSEKELAQIINMFSDYKAKGYKESLSRHIRTVLVKQKVEQFKEALIEKFSSIQYKDMFINTRRNKRKFIFFAGETNSGKTYKAFQKLTEYKNNHGIYLSPLRLLALEGYEKIKESGLACNLVTGEEKILEEGALLQSSTIELAPVDTFIPYDVAIIDEIGMIIDEQRGSAWTQALIGINANTVVLTGSLDYADFITKIVVDYLGDEIEIVHCERKNKLEIEHNPINLNNIQAGDALVVFSRKDVLYHKAVLEGMGHKVSVVYGALSPEVRKDQARMFKEGETDVLVATDAISMGLNLPIRRIVFSTTEKYYNRQTEIISVELLRQIAGRAGRYGLQEDGYVTALTANDLKRVKNKIHSKMNFEETLFLRENYSIIELVSQTINSENLVECISVFYKNTYGDYFVNTDFSVKFQLAEYLELRHKKLPLDVKYQFSSCPFNNEDEDLYNIWRALIEVIENNEKLNSLKFVQPVNGLESLEKNLKKIDLIRWFYFSFPNHVLDIDKLITLRDDVNKKIEIELSKTQNAKAKSRWSNSYR